MYCATVVSYLKYCYKKYQLKIFKISGSGRCQLCLYLFSLVILSFFPLFFLMTFVCLFLFHDVSSNRVFRSDVSQLLTVEFKGLVSGLIWKKTKLKLNQRGAKFGDSSRSHSRGSRHCEIRRSR